MERGEKHPPNSTKLHENDNSKKENIKTKTLKRKLLMGKQGVKSRGIYSKERFSQENMLAVDQGDSKGEEPGEAEEEQFSEEARKMA